MSTPSTKPKKNKLTPVGFRVNDEDNAVKPGISLDPRTGQYVIDPQTGQPKKILESAHIGLLVREATFAYIEQYEFLKKWMAQMKQAQQQPPQQQQPRATYAGTPQQPPQYGQQ